MNNREQMEKELMERGMVYSGSVKSYVGNVTPDNDSYSISHSTDAFGYYHHSNGKWIVFVTDSERGVELTSFECVSENEALVKVFDLAESNNFSDLCKKTIAGFKEKEPIIISYLMKEYNYSERKADKALAYLKQNKFVAFEFLYYVEKGVFVPSKYATEYYGYTVEKLSERDDLNLLGAFNYLVYLQKKPDEALANLKKGLPRRKYYSEKDLEEVQKNMDEKDVITGEGKEKTVNEEFI